MRQSDTKVKFFLKLARVQAQISREFDRRSGSFGWTGFQVLYYLSEAQNQRMRRIDLAEKLALTASGVTRLLLPMEKIGLVEREACAGDARVSFVKLTQAGKRHLSECMEDVELAADELLTAPKDMKNPMDFFALFPLGRIAG